jgi:hypothetical protein
MIIRGTVAGQLLSDNSRIETAATSEHNIRDGDDIQKEPTLIDEMKFMVSEYASFGEVRRVYTYTFSLSTYVEYPNTTKSARNFNACGY